MDINELIAHRLKALREGADLSLAALAELSGVSRSNISLIERGESSPTATVLDKLASALGVTLASLFAQDDGDAASPLSRAAEQPVWTDPVTGYVRRNLSPRVGSRIQLVEVVFPAGQRVAFETSTENIQQQVWIVEGAMEITAGDQTWQLATGDCLAMGLDRPVSFHNAGARPARYLVALGTPMHPSSRGTA